MFRADMADSTVAFSGRCLCGAVELTLAEKPPSVDACHCSMCRTWTGGPALGFPCRDLEVSGSEAISTYDSSPWAERSFCSRCGTHLFARIKGQNLYFVPVGLFAEFSDVPLTEEIFYDRKPSSYSFANATEKLSEQEVFARYASLGMPSSPPKD